MRTMGFVVARGFQPRNAILKGSRYEATFRCPSGSPDPTEFVVTGLVETKRNPASAGSLSENDEPLPIPLLKKEREEIKDTEYGWCG